MLFAIGFVSLFVSGGLSGLFLAQPSLDLYLHDAYFVVAHFHLIMGVAAIFGMFAGVYFWFPKMFGRFLNEGIGKVHFWITFIGVYGIFMPCITWGWLDIRGAILILLQWHTSRSCSRSMFSSALRHSLQSERSSSSCLT